MTRVPKSTQDEMQAAVDAAKEAFKTWSETSVLTRQQVMFKYQDIIKKNIVSMKICGQSRSPYRGSNSTILLSLSCSYSKFCVLMSSCFKMEKNFLLSLNSCNGLLAL